MSGLKRAFTVFVLLGVVAGLAYMPATRSHAQGLIASSVINCNQDTLNFSLEGFDNFDLREKFIGNCEFEVDSKKPYSVEQWGLNFGRAIYESWNEDQTSRLKSAQDELLRRYNSATSEDPDYHGLGVTIRREDVKEFGQGENAFLFAEASAKSQGSERNCFVYFRYEGAAKHAVKGKIRLAHGFSCPLASRVPAADLDGRMKKLVQSVRFDEGQLMRRQVIEGAVELAVTKEETAITTRAKSGDTQGPVVSDVALTNRGQFVEVAGKVSDESGVASIWGGGGSGQLAGEGTSFVLTTTRADLAADPRLVAADILGNTSSFPLNLAEMRDAAPPPPPRTGKRVAFLIGVSGYQNWPKLKSPKNDVKVLADILEKDYGFETKFIVDATASQILAALNGYVTSLTPDDDFVLFYGGHGYRAESGSKQGFWLPVDAGMNGANWLSNATIAQILAKMPSRHALVIADSCFAGNFVGPPALVASDRPFDRRASANLRSRTALSAVQADEIAWGGYSDADTSYLTETVAAILTANTDALSGTQLGQLAKSVLQTYKAGVPQYGQVNEAGHAASADFILTRQLR